MGALGLSFELLRVGKFADIGELPANLKNRCLVDVFYVDRIVCANLFRRPFGGKQPFVQVVLDEDRWPEMFAAW